MALPFADILRAHLEAEGVDTSSPTRVREWFESRGMKATTGAWSFWLAGERVPGRASLYEIAGALNLKGAARTLFYDAACKP